MDRNELGEKIKYIRNLYCKYNIALKKGQGLYCMLIEGEKIVNEVTPQSKEELKIMAEAYHHIWALCDDLKTCIGAGWNIRNHLNQITTGSVNYGTPSDDKKTIYYKDFELELFIGACLIKQGLKAELSKDPSDPKGDIYLDDVYIQIKHPSKIDQLKKRMVAFNKKMITDNGYGFFIVGLEDIFSLGDITCFNSDDCYLKWRDVKYNEIESFGTQHIIPIAEKMDRILGLAQTSTRVYWIGDSSRLIRFGNSLIFSKNSVPEAIMKTANQISDTFNLNSHLFIGSKK